MKKAQWILLLVTLGLMASSAGVLLRLRAGQRLGEPGLKLSPGPGTNGWVVALPEQLPGFSSDPVAVTDLELSSLPKDTTFGRRQYRAPDGFSTFVSVVLMGTDRTSIHKPQFCLVGQGWSIDRSEITTIPMTQPRPYELPVMKLTTSKQLADERGQPVTARGVYVYWFVADNRLTARHSERMAWMAKDLLRLGVLQRWAYVTCFSTCPPGQEAATFERMKKFIMAVVPEFQLAAGPEATQKSP